MAALSDALLIVAMLAYLVAMICYAAVYAFGDRGDGLDQQHEPAA